MRTGIIIQARTGSSRLPNKVLLPFYNGETILGIIINRFKEEFSNIPIVLATSDSDADTSIALLAKKYGVMCFRGSEENVLDRIIQSALNFKIDKIIRVCADNPFIDIELLRSLINVKGDFDYVGFKFNDSTPVIKSHLGLIAELTTLNTLKKVNAVTSNNLYLEHVTNYIYSNEHEFNIQWLNLPLQLQERKDLRFTLDTEIDFRLHQELFTRLIVKFGKTRWEKLVELADSNPRYLDLMRSEIQKNSK